MMDWRDISFEDGGVGSSEVDMDENNNSKHTSTETATSNSQFTSQNVDVTERNSKACTTMMCKLCPYTSRSRGNMYRHKKAVHKGIRFECETCSKTFSQKYDLGQHSKSVHDNTKLMCEKCSECFNTRFSLRRHRVMVHTNEAKFTCAICNKKFYENAAYLGHVNNHVDAKPYSCLLCKKGFAFQHSMKRHMNSCGTHENTHPCEICQTNYKSMNSLKAHKRGVHGKKDKCCPCGKSFSWPSSYVRHRKTCRI